MLSRRNYKGYRYRTLIENMIDIVFTADKELNFTSIDPADQRVFEYSKEDVTNINLCKLIYEDDRGKIVDCLKVFFSIKGEYIEGIEFRTKTMNGNIKHLALNARANYNENDDLVQIEGIIRDITERRKLEQKLSQIDSLNTLGLQASGIAHELNNILGIILGHLGILKLRLEDTGIQTLNRSDRKPLWPESNARLISDTIDVIERAARDGAVIVGKIQQFSKYKPSNSGVIHVNLIDVVNEAIEFTMPRWKDKAQTKGLEYKIINDNLNHSGLYVRCNPTELREVIVNIINNSIDAMPNGGKIEFSAKTDAESVVLSISDNGIGVKENIKDKIFDPFFTTKGVNGSGLGMSVVYGIVKRYGGEISIDSHWGKGTTVHIKMPLCLL
ncbi:MAG: two component sensor histidine kinase [Candidatus Scalindua rubra]|uniref:histidine kinase n=1 Tax=Candidatus Scalindua rubra TaxID=1872076 RepID=A0A1E3XFA4_9BACT|nr:MAG: two component sensor histidine kinase [Candidatus Scalindua rubra]